MRPGQPASAKRVPTTKLKPEAEKAGRKYGRTDPSLVIVYNLGLCLVSFWVMMVVFVFLFLGFAFVSRKQSPH